MTQVTYVLYITDAKSYGEKTTAQPNTVEQTQSEPILYLEDPTSQGTYLPKVTAYQRASGELFAESPATGSFTDQAMSQYIKSDIDSGANYVRKVTNGVGTYVKATNQTVYYQSSADGYSPYVAPVKYSLGTSGFYPDADGKYVQDTINGGYSDDLSVNNPTTVLLRMRKSTDDALYVYKAMMPALFWSKLKIDEWMHHELACRTLPAMATMAHVYNTSTMAIDGVRLAFEVPKSPDCDEARVIGSKSGDMFIWTTAKAPHDATPSMSKDESLYVKTWKFNEPAPVGYPGEMVIFTCRYIRNRPYNITKYYSCPAITGGTVIAKRNHPDTYWSNTTMKLYDVQCEGVLLENLLATDFTEYNVDDWVSILKVTAQTAVLDPVEHLMSDVLEYKGKFEGYTPFRDRSISEFVYRVSGLESEYLSGSDELANVRFMRAIVDATYPDRTFDITLKGYEVTGSVTGAEGTVPDVTKVTQVPLKVLKVPAEYICQHDKGTHTHKVFEKKEEVLVAYDGKFAQPSASNLVIIGYPDRVKRCLTVGYNTHPRTANSISGVAYSRGTYVDGVGDVYNDDSAPGLQNAGFNTTTNVSLGTVGKLYPLVDEDKANLFIGDDGSGALERRVTGDCGNIDWCNDDRDEMKILTWKGPSSRYWPTSSLLKIPDYTEIDYQYTTDMGINIERYTPFTRWLYRRGKRIASGPQRRNYPKTDTTVSNNGMILGAAYAKLGSEEVIIAAIRSCFLTAPDNEYRVIKKKPNDSDGKVYQYFETQAAADGYKSTNESAFWEVVQETNDGVATWVVNRNSVWAGRYNSLADATARKVEEEGSTWTVETIPLKLSRPTGFEVGFYVAVAPDLEGSLQCEEVNPWGWVEVPNCKVDLKMQVPMFFSQDGLKAASVAQGGLIEVAFSGSALKPTGAVTTKGETYTHSGTITQTTNNHNENCVNGVAPTSMGAGSGTGMLPLTYWGSGDWGTYDDNNGTIISNSSRASDYSGDRGSKTVQAWSSTTSGKTLVAVDFKENTLVEAWVATQGSTSWDSPSEDKQTWGMVTGPTTYYRRVSPFDWFQGTGWRFAWCSHGWKSLQYNVKKNYVRTLTFGAVTKKVQTIDRDFTMDARHGATATPGDWGWVSLRSNRILLFHDYHMEGGNGATGTGYWTSYMKENYKVVDAVVKFADLRRDILAYTEYEDKQDWKSTELGGWQSDNGVLMEQPIMYNGPDKAHAVNVPSMPRTITKKYEVVHPKGTTSITDSPVVSSADSSVINWFPMMPHLSWPVQWEKRGFYDFYGKKTDDPDYIHWTYLNPEWHGGIGRDRSIEKNDSDLFKAHYGHTGDEIVALPGGATSVIKHPATVEMPTYPFMYDDIPRGSYVRHPMDNSIMISEVEEEGCKVVYHGVTGGETDPSEVAYPGHPNGPPSADQVVLHPIVPEEKVM